MEIEKTQLEQIIAQAANPDRLEPDQIPELDLYIDQILMLFEDKLGDNRRHEKDKILTKSMVNNYSKERMIRPMRGKKYTREQILQILLICSLKNMLSIGDIKRLMTALMEEGVQAQGLEEIFRNDRDNQQSLRQDVEVIIQHLHSDYAEQMDTTELVSLLLGLARISNCCRRASETIIDRFLGQKEQGKKQKKTKGGTPGPPPGRGVSLFFITQHEKEVSLLNFFNITNCAAKNQGAHAKKWAAAAKNVKSIKNARPFAQKFGGVGRSVRWRNPPYKNKAAPVFLHRSRPRQSCNFCKFSLQSE